LAAENGHEAVVRLLLKRNDVNANSKDSCHHRTPLSWAAGSGHESVVRLLLERDDVDADLKDNYYRTPLSWAAVNGHGAVVRLLKSFLLTSLV
jgi:ankyrin repeat protein